MSTVVGASRLGLTPDELYDEVLNAGGVYIPPGSDSYTEWKENLSVGKRRALGSRNPRSETLDQFADSAGMSTSELIEALRKAHPASERSRALRKEEEELARFYRELLEEEEYKTRDNINVATVEALQEVKGIGPKLAAKIVKYQPYLSARGGVYRLSDVKGIGSKTIDRLLRQFVVEPVEESEVPF